MSGTVFTGLQEYVDACMEVDEYRLIEGADWNEEIGTLIEVRAEPEELAKKLDGASIDLMAASSIKVDRDLGNGKSVAGLTLEVTGIKG